MASKSRRKSLALIEKLEQEPYQFDFFQAVRTLEQAAGRTKSDDPSTRHPVGQDHAPRDEAVRFLALPSHTFPASEIASFHQKDSTTVPPMAVSFMGMTGPSGVLPQHYTQLVIDRIRHKDFALRDFLDLFNHRAISLFYRAWRKYRFYVEFEHEAQQGREDLFTKCLYSLVGLGTPGLRNRQEFLDETFLYYSGHFAHSPRSAVSLRQIIADRFQLEIDVIQFVGQWLYLDEDDQSRPQGANVLDEGNNCLGATTVVGERVRSFENKFRLQLGPLSYREFQRFSPNGDRLIVLCQLVRSYVGPEFDFDIQPVLKAEAVPMCQLAGLDSQPSFLGWNTWTHNQAFSQDADDAVFTHDGNPTR